MTEEKSSQVQVHQNAGGTLSWIDDCYWYVCFNDGHDITLDEYSAFLVVATDYLDYKAPLIVERKHSYSAQTDVYTFGEEVLSLSLNAIAFVSYSSTSTTVTEHIRTTYLHALPVEIFPNMELAIKWVKENYTGGPRVPIGKQ